jgi:hypothetical protein
VGLITWVIFVVPDQMVELLEKLIAARVAILGQ